MNPDKCIICGGDECRRYVIRINPDGLVEKWKYECEYCGKYEIDDRAVNLLTYEKFNEKYKLQSYIREQNDIFNEITFLTVEKIKQIIEMPDKTLKEQFDLFMKNLFEFLSKDLVWRDISDKLVDLRIKSWIKNYYYFQKLIEKAIEKGFIKSEGYYEREFYFVDNIGFIDVKLPIIEDFTFKGLEYIESLNQLNQNSKKIFLAFKFDEELNKIFKNTISDMIRNLGLNPVIVDQDITSHNEKISDKIISEIKSSRILIADLTHHSQNVYYEIGYAMGMGIPIILTCKKDFLQNVAFDINQYPVFEWENEYELKEKIENRIKILL